ncbi:MAG: geranylgeranylglyceryl/heptaprenylglyceryl phosphate synthase [Thermoplasmata archaeon]
MSAGNGSGPGMGPVESGLRRRLAGGPIHLTLIDPEKSSPADAARLAQGAADLGTAGILLGGSTGISPDRMGAVVRAVRTAVPVPTIIFPEGPGSVAAGAHAILFMSLLNSRNLDLVIRIHARTARTIRAAGLETIPLGYLVIAPGMRVGEVGQADPIARDDPASAQGYALAAEMLGMRWVYLEAGSGAPDPVPPAMVRAVREVLRIPLIVGGGIRTARDARATLDAGADVLVTGTVAEEHGAAGALAEILAEVGRGARRGP